jgi:predicted nucleotidyltransferase component of viral defense system
MIESRELFVLQSRLTKGEKAIPVKSLEKDYVLSWLLIGIAKSKLCKNVAFKGGTALKKFYFPDYRFSEDLDFTLLSEMSLKEIELQLQEIYKIVLDESNVKLALKNSEEHMNGYTFYINFSGPLGADITRGEIKADFTVKEKLIFKPSLKKLMRGYDEYSDIPEDIEMKIYTLGEIFIEKILSLLDNARREPRDIYDLWYFLKNKCADYELLAEPILEKGRYKEIVSFDILLILKKKENAYKKLWEKRLAYHIIDLPIFGTIYRELKRFLKPINKNINDLL